MKHSKKMTAKMLREIEIQTKQQQAQEERERLTCKEPGHLFHYEKDEHGNFIQKCYSCNSLKRDLESLNLV